jgi:integrase/recombinase XerD
MEPEFEAFIRERKYLKNVTLKTQSWYAQAFRHLANPNPTQADLTEFVVRLRKAGLKPVSVNCFARAINAYLKWSGSSLKIPRLKEEQKVLPMFKETDIERIVRWTPKSRYEQRTQLLVLMLCDTGCRISELLTLRWSKVDMDNLLVTVLGKGQKERTIPFSYELRRFLFRYQKESKYGLVFACNTGTALTPRNAHHTVERFCKRVGIEAPERLLHSLRHLYATTYLRRGGNLFCLQRALGHTSLTMVRRYAQTTVDDLQSVHQRVSLLSR